MKLPDPPLEIIALSLSGGGYRACAFHLGTLTYLGKIQFSNKTLLSRIKVLSTVSGGSFTGAIYAASIQNGESLQDCYNKLYRFMYQVDLITESLSLLCSKDWNQFKTRNLINAFSEIYYKYLVKEKFDVFWNGHVSHLSEIVFNSTDFSHGINFRFQKSKDNEGYFGNYYARMDVNMARNIRLSDVIASSSCFPAGFEPLSFPNDYRYEEAKDFNSYAEELLTKYESDFPIYIMDGGIYDNQGIDSVILAKERMKNSYPELSKKDNPIDLYIISDVTSDFMEPLKMNIPFSRGLLAKLSLAKFKLLGFVLWALTFLSIGCLYLSSKKEMVVLFSLLTFSFLFLSVVSSFLGNLLLKKIPKWFKIHPLFMRPIKLLNKLDFDVYKHFIIERKDSILKMVSEVFLKQIRRLSYKQIYANEEWKNRRIMNDIYELTNDSLDNNKKKYELLCDQPLNPSKVLIETAQIASSMGTTLWFTPEQLKEPNNILNSIIACGQFTICYNLIRYIDKLRSEIEYSDYSTDTKNELNQLYTNLFNDWKNFNSNPYWFQQSIS